ncbi:PDZ and LIM domain protein 7 isoform X2 [Microcaecilia unicolor]|uniref:PDZ and LIM domain protein 7 n=1 Tax=Microcaecilia unicolor TaxID=1415580 RepID=A0A6P7YQ76_9AMPH|nr:PDZ and LIM domain protein 7 isoform X2 [Microcaecilia unicolor]
MCVVKSSRNTKVMSNMSVFKVTLEGPAPWGFRLQGGKDFSMPLSISRLSPGGKATQAGVAVGDWVLSIDGENATTMTHIEAQNKIRSCSDKLALSLSRASHPMGPSQKDLLSPDSQGPKYNFVSSPALNKTAQPFGSSGVLESSQSASVTRPMAYTPPPLAAALHQNGQKPRSGSTVPAFTSDAGPDPLTSRPASTGPASRPPWIIDPAFAERYAPDKSSTVLTKHSQPVTLTPMQNRSSIMQAAQQAPEGSSKTPVCHQCNRIIRGRYLLALGHYYHPEDFICCQCRKVLDEGGFFEEQGSIYCPKCHDLRYAPNCAKCKKKIAGEIMHALKMTWHVQCFTCVACKTAIRNRAFYMEEGQPYCERDYEKMFGTKCRGCDFKIDAGDRFLEALGYSWHDTCFVCAILVLTGVRKLRLTGVRKLPNQ